MPRIILAGNSHAAIEVLARVRETCADDEILAVAPRGGALHSWQPSLAAAASDAGVRCLMPADVNAPDVVGEIADHRPDLLLSVYYTQIFRPNLLGAVAGPVLNFHPSLLPRHRGTAPLIWAIAEGDRVTGLTVHHVDEGIDTGDIIVQLPLPIHREDTGHSLHRKMAHLVGGTASELLRRVAAGRALPEPRAQTGSPSYHGSRDPRLNHLDFSAPRRRVRDIVRALAPPLPGAYGNLDGVPLVLARVEPFDAAGSVARQPGMLDVPPSGLPVVWVGDGALEIVLYVHDGEVRSGGDLVANRSVSSGMILS
jgi:methionyl-tRNA formyltransferase